MDGQDQVTGERFYLLTIFAKKASNVGKRQIFSIFNEVCTKAFFLNGFIILLHFLNILFCNVHFSGGIIFAQDMRVSYELKSAQHIEKVNGWKLLVFFRKDHCIFNVERGLRWSSDGCFINIC